MEIEEETWPLYLYVYRMDGKHEGKVVIQDKAALHVALYGPVAKAILDGREAIITNVGDDCVFHTAGGVVLWPTKEALGYDS